MVEEVATNEQLIAGDTNWITRLIEIPKEIENMHRSWEKFGVKEWP
ncbi:hypothetical protein [Tateyamaria sp.]